MQWVCETKNLSQQKAGAFSVRVFEAHDLQHMTLLCDADSLERLPIQKPQIGRHLAEKETVSHSNNSSSAITLFYKQMAIFERFRWNVN